MLSHTTLMKENNTGHKSCCRWPVAAYLKGLYKQTSALNLHILTSRYSIGYFSKFILGTWVVAVASLSHWELIFWTQNCPDSYSCCGISPPNL